MSAPDGRRDLPWLERWALRWWSAGGRRRVAVLRAGAVAVVSVVAGGDLLRQERDLRLRCG